MFVVLGLLLGALLARFPFEGCVAAGGCAPEWGGSVPDLAGMAFAEGAEPPSKTVEDAQ